MSETSGSPASVPHVGSPTTTSDAATVTPQPFWRRISPEMQDALNRRGFGWGYLRTDPTCRLLTYKRPGGDADVADIAWTTRTPGGWRHFTVDRQPPDYEAHRMFQALLNRERWDWGIAPDSRKGATIHVVANGPSARRALGRVAPDDVVIPINGAVELRNEGLPVTWWCFGDAFFAGCSTAASQRAWLIDLYARVRIDDLVGIHTAFAYHEVVRQLAGGHFWFGCHQGPALFYRHLVPTGRRVLTLTHGPQTVSAMVHLAQLVGGAKCVLWGADCGIPGATEPSVEGLHAGLAAADYGNPIVSRPWYPVEGYEGPVLTTLAMDLASRHLDAVCAWAWEAGMPVYSGGNGTRLAAAPPLPGERAA